MKPYDLMILGPATRDVNIDYTGAEDRSAGGAVTFCTPAARAMGASVFAAVKIAPEDRDILDVFQMPDHAFLRLQRSVTYIFNYPRLR